ncbi:Alpha-taxilin like [Actinidia chinensis var. chinensis]|uniref:Alpha-taxilin like n=1 Tax=Actinidia chinensis var. chinensis TaxID=1590841 RepID=A0A2R6P620_ACTCC|nr:Alpha-taxilin like [Actinidia chinensis var. chinensis]
MGFNSVYRVLMEVFPQVDTRVLRAVAIEHSKDADTAVEVVLVEVIPFLSKGTTASGSSSDAIGDANPSDRAEDIPLDTGYMDETVESLNGFSCYDVNNSCEQMCGYDGNGESVSLGKHEQNNVKMVPYVTSHLTPINITHDSSADDDCIPVNAKREEISSLQGSSSVEAGPDQGSHVSSTTLIDGCRCAYGILNGNLLFNWERFGGPSACDCNVVTQGESLHEGEEINSLQGSSSVNVVPDQGAHVSSTTSIYDSDCTNGILNGNQQVNCKGFGGPSDCELEIQGESHQEHNHLDDNHLEVVNSMVQLTPSPDQDGIPDAPEDNHQLSAVCPVNRENENPESTGSSSSAFKKYISAVEMDDFEDESNFNTVVTRSGQICRIDMLEDLIEDARSNKKALFSAMESVLSLMREVELQEKAAEQAKEEAVKGGLDILGRVEDLKQMLQHAKDANSMHAGEVYGEKAILATEARELQSRLLSLSDERDRSLAILVEMHQTLEERFDATEKERKASEQEKMEKEESAKHALSEQELIMEKVVQESKMLKQEAEENSKLREFLMDRGRVVDMLQGEISVICQDVKLLKEKFDERVPLSKSLSSSQTTCILASSSSSLKSLAPDQVPELVESPETPKSTSPKHSVDGQVSLERREREMIARH